MYEVRKQIAGWADQIERASKKGSMNLSMTCSRLILEMRAMAAKTEWALSPQDIMDDVISEETSP